MDEGAIMDRKDELAVMQELVSVAESWILDVIKAEGGEFRITFGNETVVHWLDSTGEHRLTVFRKCSSRRFTDFELDEDWFTSKR